MCNSNSEACLAQQQDYFPLSTVFYFKQLTMHSRCTFHPFSGNPIYYLCISTHILYQFKALILTELQPVVFTDMLLYHLRLSNQKVCLHSSLLELKEFYRILLYCKCPDGVQIPGQKHKPLRVSEQAQSCSENYQMLLFYCKIIV